MTRPTRLTTALFTAVAALALATTAHAQPTEGEVTKIEKPLGRITLRHGEIKNLEMPPMTMVFRVQDAAVLDTLARGDKVTFTAEKIDGHFVVTTIRKAP